jgi:hypothetical protein
MSIGPRPPFGAIEQPRRLPRCPAAALAIAQGVDL